ncbi:MAG: AbrB/MazE/SpoVT family DNA-binding domain-containing protein [Thermoleophilaceae bacterium]
MLPRRTPRSRAVTSRRIPGIRATIDKAGRLVIPQPLRERLGLRPGPVEVTADGAGIRVEALTEESVEERDGRIVIPASGAVIDDDTVRSLRDADQR